MPSPTKKILDDALALPEKQREALTIPGDEVDARIRKSLTQK